MQLDVNQLIRETPIEKLMAGIFTKYKDGGYFVYFNLEFYYGRKYKLVVLGSVDWWDYRGARLDLLSEHTLTWSDYTQDLACCLCIYKSQFKIVKTKIENV